MYSQRFIVISHFLYCCNEKKQKSKISSHCPFKVLLLLLAVHIVSAGAVTVHAVAKCDAVGEAAAGDAAVGDVVGDADG